MSENQAKIGGCVAILNSQATVIINNCNFTNNSANSHAGAIYLEEIANSDITGCRFEKNVAANSSEGPIYLQKSTYLLNLIENGICSGANSSDCSSPPHSAPGDDLMLSSCQENKLHLLLYCP